jgi:hypothetical protein
MELDLFTINPDAIPNAYPNGSLRALALVKANVLSGKSSGQVGRGITVATDGVAQIGAAYTGIGTLYYAAFDASGFDVTGSAYAGLRLAPNMGIDFSTVVGTASSILLRQMLWNSTSGNLEYQKSGSAVFSITDVGGVISPSVVASSGNLTLGVQNASLVQLVNPSSATPNYMTISYNAAINSVKISSTTSNLELSSVSSIFIGVPLTGIGWTNSMAAPPAIGGTTAAAGMFTTLGTTSTLTLGGSIIETATQAFGTGGTKQIASGTSKVVVFTSSAITLVMPPAPSIAASSFLTLEVFFAGSANASVTWSLGTGTQSFGGAPLPTSVANGAIIKFIWDQGALSWIHVLSA